MSDYKRIVISSGHSKHVRGASGVLDEVNEARKVVEHLADELISKAVEVMVFHDDTSKTQNENLDTIVDYHNSQKRDLDISIHFNAYVETTKPMGTECLYVSQDALAGQVASAIASVGFINRGPKKRTDLFFLNHTDMPAILIEVCFVDSATDADIYHNNFHDICTLIADALVGDAAIAQPPLASDAALLLAGKCSWFGGPNDMGVAPDEALAFIHSIDDAPQLFLPQQPPNTSGLARRLDPHAHYIACRWDYEATPREQLLEEVALVRAVKTGRVQAAYPADWGPHVDTGRIADISPGLMEALGIQTDDEVEVLFPFVRRVAKLE